MQRKVFIEESVNEITYYIPYNDRNTSSHKPSSRTDPTEDLREIRKTCQDLQKLLRHESKKESDYLFTCLEKIQKLLDKSGCDIRSTMDSARSVLKSNKNVINEKSVTDEVITTSLAVIDDIKTNTQYYLDQLGISISRVLTEILDPSKKDHGYVDVVQELIQKLEVNESGKRTDLLEAAQRKVKIK